MIDESVRIGMRVTIPWGAECDSFDDDARQRSAKQGFMYVVAYDRPFGKWMLNDIDSKGNEVGLFYAEDFEEMDGAEEYEKQKLEKIKEYERTAEKFEKFFNCKLSSFDPGYVFWFPDDNIHLTIPRWFVEKFNKITEEK